MKLNLRDESPDSKVSEFFFRASGGGSLISMIIKFLQLRRRKNQGPGWEKTLTDAGEQAADEIYTVQGDRMSQRRPPTNY